MKQIKNFSFGSTILCNGLGYLWQNVGEKEMETMCHIVETRCNDIQRQRRLVGMREMKLLFLYRELENTCEEERRVHGAAG